MVSSSRTIMLNSLQSLSLFYFWMATFLKFSLCAIRFIVIFSIDLDTKIPIYFTWIGKYPKVVWKHISIRTVNANLIFVGKNHACYLEEPEKFKTWMNFIGCKHVQMECGSAPVNKYTRACISTNIARVAYKKLLDLGQRMQYVLFYFLFCLQKFWLKTISIKFNSINEHFNQF